MYRGSLSFPRSQTLLISNRVNRVGHVFDLLFQAIVDDLAVPAALPVHRRQRTVPRLLLAEVGVCGIVEAEPAVGSRRELWTQAGRGPEFYEQVIVSLDLDAVGAAHRVVELDAVEPDDRPVIRSEVFEVVRSFPSVNTR